MGMNLLPKEYVADLAVYEPGRPLDEVARELGLAAPEELIKLASNENPLGPSPSSIDAMHAKAEHMHLYPDGGGFYLKKALADHLGVGCNELILGNGSNELIEFLGHVFLERGTNLVMSDCAFLIYKLVASSFGAETRSVPMQHFTHDLEAMLDAIDEQTRLVFIANPNNPTGTIVDTASFDAFMAKVPDHVLVVLDEAYVELLDESDDPKGYRFVQFNKPILQLRTFSKAYGLAGLRVGYGIASPEIIRLLEKFRQPFNVNAMAQAAAEAALQDQKHVQALVDLVQEGHAFFVEACEAMGLEFVPSKANFILIRTGNGRKVFEALQKQGVIVRPMDAYKLPDYIRVTLGTMEENARCIDALKEVLS